MATTPFDIDTDKYKKFLQKDISIDKYGGEVVDAEIVEDGEEDDGFSKMMPTLPSPKDFNKIQELQKEASPQIDSNLKLQVKKAFTSLVESLNKKYNLNVTLDFDSFSNSITNLISSVNEKAAEYYLSIAYGKFRVVMYQQYLQAISLLSAQLLSPQYLLSESMTYMEKMDMILKLHELMEKMNAIYDQVHIMDTEMKLEKLVEERGNKVDFRDPGVSDLIENLNKSILEGKKDKTKKIEP